MPSTMSLPATRHRRTGSLTLTASDASSPVYRAPGSGMPCSTTVVGWSPQSQAMALKAVTCATSTSCRRGSPSTGCSLRTACSVGALCSR